VTQWGVADPEVVMVVVVDIVVMKMLSSITDRESDVDLDKLDALTPENVNKNRDKAIVPCTQVFIS